MLSHGNTDIKKISVLNEKSDISEILAIFHRNFKPYIQKGEIHIVPQTHTKIAPSTLR